MATNTRAHGSREAVGAQTARSNYLDSWKGIAILAVVAIHSISSSLAPQTAAVVFQPFDFAVPFFLALSGYFAGGHELATREGLLVFWRRRVVRLLPPYIVWSLITILVTSRSHFLEPRALLGDILLGRGITIGFYVLVLLQCVAVTPLIARIERRMVHVIVMVTVTAVALGVRYYLQLVAPGAIMSQFPFYALPFVAWYPFYHLGFFIRTRETVRAKWVLVLLIGYGLFLVCSFLEGRALIQAGATEMAGSQIRISSFLMSLMLFMWVITRMPRENSGAKVLIWLGRNSFFIYLSHLLIMSMTVRLLDLVEFGNAPGVARTVVLAGATLLACVVIGLVLQRLLPGQIAVNFLGLDRSRMGLRRAGRAIALPPR